MELIDSDNPYQSIIISYGQPRPTIHKVITIILVVVLYTFICGVCFVFNLADRIYYEYIREHIRGNRRRRRRQQVNWVKYFFEMINFYW